MKYMGSKARHAKDLLAVMLPYRKEGMYWVEPFVGGANMIDKVEGNRIGVDIHPYLIHLWQAVAKGWLPPSTFTESKYKEVKENKDNNPVLAGYVGFAYSYGGKWWGGWCRDGEGKRNYVDEANRNAHIQFPKLKGVVFMCCSYDEFALPPESLIYCDPPYKGTTKYKDNFNHEAFYDWCRQKRKEGHTIFISEYEMPEDFECIWQKEVTSSLTKDTGSKKAVEKLFTLP